MKWDQIYPSTPRQTKSHLKSSIRPNNSDISIFKNQGGGKEPLGPHQRASLLLLSLSAVSSNFQFISLLVQLVDWNILLLQGAFGVIQPHLHLLQEWEEILAIQHKIWQILCFHPISFEADRNGSTRTSTVWSLPRTCWMRVWSRFFRLRFDLGFYHVYSRSPKLLQHSPTTPTTTCTRRWKILRRRSLRLSSTWTCATSGKGREEEGKLGIWLIMKIGSKEKVKMTS